MNLKKINDNYIELLILTSLFCAGCLALTRSLWIDEAMIIVNIKEIAFFDIFKPLPYYTQASPLTPLAFHKFLYSIFGPNFIAIRLFSLIISVLALAVFLYNLPQNISKTSWVVSLITATYYFLFYATEIKHYGFEFISSLLIINAYFFYLSKSYLKVFVFSILGLTLGFSNIIPFGVMLGFILLLKIKRKDLDTKYIQYLLLSLIFAIISYFYMKYLTSIQLKSHDVYLSQGIILDTKTLIYCALNSHGILLTLLTGLSFIFGLSKFNNNKCFRQFSWLYICIILAIYILKLTSLYPVIYKRHLIWLLPFSITLSGMFLQNIFTRLSNAKFKKITIICSVILLIVSFLGQTYRYYIKAEFTANNKLIDNVNYLCRQQNSNIISTEWADRVLNAYQHKLDISCNIDIPPPASNQPKYKESFVNKLNLFDDKSNNFLILSHLDVKKDYSDIDEASKANDYYEFKKYISDKGLGYSVYFYDNKVAVLELYQSPSSKDDGLKLRLQTGL